MNAYEQAVRSVQFLSVDAVARAASGHPGAPMGLADIGVELFANHLRYHPEDPAWPNRDRFVLSCGHASMLLYSLLHLTGYELSIEDLKQFRQWGAKTAGHPEYGMIPGIETTTGPLGQGLGNSVGMALASRLMAARVNQPDSELVNYRVFAITSDGDMMEGVASEAAALAGHWGLDNLTVIYDDNQITIDGGTELAAGPTVGRQYEALGWHVQAIDGHDARAIRSALDKAQAHTGQPSLIVARTHIGHGAPKKQDSSASHGAPLGAEETAGAKAAAGWPLEPDFYVPDGARSAFTAQRRKNREYYDAWTATRNALTGEREQLWQQFSSRSTPDDLLERLLASVDASTSEATRSFASKVEQQAAALIPNLIGGSADLAASTKTTIQGSAAIARENFGGRNIHFGVREHGMAAVLNGLALSGFFVPFGSTFLIFSDYLRPSIRLAALMRQQVVHVFTHDSIYVGEDGPTHQPVEQLWSLRMIPNVHVFRPADAIESAAAWTHALTRADGPTTLALSRQALPPLQRSADFDPKIVLRGAYVLSDTEGSNLTLIATGSEVGIAVEVRKMLENKGRRVRVVSAPCWDLFEALPSAEQDAVLGTGARVSIEAGSTLGWRGVVGRNGICIGVNHFGASAPWTTLAEQFGLTAEKVAARILSEVV